jgi:hypothetical protein
MFVIHAAYGRFILVNQCIAAMQQKHDAGLTAGRRKGLRQTTFGGVSRQTTQESCFGGNPYGVEAAGMGR